MNALTLETFHGNPAPNLGSGCSGKVSGGVGGYGLRRSYANDNVLSQTALFVGGVGGSAGWNNQSPLLSKMNVITAVVISLASAAVTGGVLKNGSGSSTGSPLKGNSSDVD
ncbi:hypothetical protein KI387_001052, partial [Taxus chinensis]